MTKARQSAHSVLDRTLRVDDIPAAGELVAIDVPARSLHALAEAMGVERVLKAHAELNLARAAGGAVEVRGRASAVVEQICVVTLEPFESTISEPIDIRFAPQAEVEAAEARLRGRPAEDENDAPDLPEPIENGILPLGALVQEFLALAVDPYPRKPGAVFEGGKDAADERVSPFAALAKLRKEPDGD